jgi:hypothetical protein
MKRFQLTSVAMLALFVFGAVLAASASATVTFLLAEWLVSGVAVTTELLTEVPGTLVLRDTGLKAAVKCEGFLDGWIGPNSLGYGSEVLNTAKESISTTNLSGLAHTCSSVETCSGTAELWTLNLGWEIEVELMEDGGSIYYAALLLAHSGGGQPGWSTVCTVLGIKEEDECTAPSGGAGVAEFTLSGTSLLVVSSEAFTLLAEATLASCSLGGSETGEVSSFEGKGAPFEISGGGELTASSEGETS